MKYYNGQCILILLILTLFGCGIQVDNHITTMTVQKESYKIKIPAMGNLEAVKSTPIIVPSQLKWPQPIAWLIQENTFVKKGEVVVRLDDQWYINKIKEESYNISKLDLEIKKKKKELQKEKNDIQGAINIASIEKNIAQLYGAKDETIFSKNEILDALADLKYLNTKDHHLKEKKIKLEKKALTELQLLQLKKSTHQVKLDQYKSAIKSLEICAPHDGLFIYERNWRGEEPRVGMQVWRGRKLGKLPDLSLLQAKIYVQESEANGLKENLPVLITLDAYSTIHYNGQVRTIEKVAKSLHNDSPLKYFEVTVALENTDTNRMKPGNQVNAIITVEEQENVLTVPNQALFQEDDQNFVYIKNSSRIEKRRVKITSRSLTRSVVSDGLNPGDEILLDEYKSNNIK